MEKVKHWHAVYTASRAEKKVKERLDELGIENFLPIQTVVRQWKYRKQKVTVPVIAGMIFVRVSRKEQLGVLHTKGVVAFLRLRGSTTAAVIPDRQMKDFCFLVDFSEEAIEMVNEKIEVGDRVTVIKGPLTGLKGELVHVNGASKVLVRVEVLGCAMVDIPSSFVVADGKEYS